MDFCGPQIIPVVRVTLALNTENQFGRNKAEKILKFQLPLGSVKAIPVKYQWWNQEKGDREKGHKKCVYVGAVCSSAWLSLEMHLQSLKT